MLPGGMVLFAGSDYADWLSPAGRWKRECPAGFSYPLREGSPAPVTAPLFEAACSVVVETRINEIETKPAAMHKANAISHLLATIPGIRPIIALTLATEVDPAAFGSGRHLAASIALTPREHSIAGKQRMGGLSRPVTNGCANYW